MKNVPLYRISPNFRGGQFSRIAISKHFAETIFADQEFQVYGLGSAKTAKITRLEKLDVYGTTAHMEHKTHFSFLYGKLCGSSLVHL